MTDEKPEHVFFVDAKRHETTKHHLNGAEIKQFGEVPTGYQLFLEEEGDKPDKPIVDSETVSLEERIKHFYAVPPATFGCR